MATVTDDNAEIRNLDARLFYSNQLVGTLGTNIICFDICQVQYLNPLSVRIRAKISPSGNEAIIRIADANQDAATDNDMIPRL